MSWKPEVIADNSGVWTGNALRFETEGEAKDYASDLACRWTSVREWRAVEDSHQPNYRWVKGKLQLIVPDVLYAAPVAYTEEDIRKQQSALAAIFGEEELLK